MVKVYDAVEYGKKVKGEAHEVHNYEEDKKEKQPKQQKEKTDGKK